MLPAMHKVRVALDARSYDIVVGRGLLSELGSRCRRLGLGRRCAVLTDSRVAPHHLPAALASLQGAGFDTVPVEVPSGEKSIAPTKPWPLNFSVVRQA